MRQPLHCKKNVVFFLAEEQVPVCGKQLNKRHLVGSKGMGGVGPSPKPILRTLAFARRSTLHCIAGKRKGSSEGSFAEFTTILATARPSAGGSVQTSIRSLMRWRANSAGAFNRMGLPHRISSDYPAAFAEAYIRPEVRLEIGPLASWIPSSTRIIRPYAFDVLARLFENPDCEVLAIAAERTFWEGNHLAPGGAPPITNSIALLASLL